MEIHDLSGPWGRLRVAELGACVLGWRPAGHDEVLFTAREARLVPGSMWHSGIPVCAPWFGSGRGAFPVPFTHGLVSRVPWRTLEVTSDERGARVRLAVESPAFAHLPGAGHYPDDLGYRLDVTADARRLRLELTVDSPTRDTVVDIALHPYLRCEAPEATVTGLDGVRFVDYAQGAARGVEFAPVGVGRAVDRVYAAAPPTRLTDGARELRLSGAGARNVVVWNPGPGGAQVADGQWREFACVEYGCVQGGAVAIPAAGSHTLGLTVAVAPRPAAGR
ncbi:hypothetical protein BCR15_00660 [Tessaracoccus lapidicaptus]|uniref:Uncharacterized protein n=1 Tax=Tessaracoccus lapidicaptus TaxID=1427523 RepID=A0A1C0AQ39_9ACTN|nr:MULTISPECIES: hypothetical protein [Tessaracoccus]AQX15271.1 hypothetical protein BKM78_04495 [Tessaracoccus sp. T2.5-30]OCL36417.1 hypothetical protein BCR15_00660 [Tessaracoccus lapidicaptus]VEP39533.1 Putative glucose-6-phosphate 1-epimerase [Tessaracoccus lapidicaptus]